MTYVPQMPTLLCGGNQDPTVYFDINTSSMAAIIQGNVAQNPALKVNVTVLDVDKTNAAMRNKPTLTTIGSDMSNPWLMTAATDNVQNRFAATFKSVSDTAAGKVIAAGGTQIQAAQAAQAAILGSYHGGLVSTACTQATREFFNQSFVQASAQ